MYFVLLNKWGYWCGKDKVIKKTEYDGEPVAVSEDLSPDFWEESNILGQH